MLGSTPPVGSANVLPELPPSPPPQGSPRAGGSNQTTGATPAAGGASGAETSAQGAGEKRAGLSDLLEEATVHPTKKQKTDAGKSDPNVAPPKAMFSPEDMKELRDAKKVVVAGFSSQGGGHTERMFAPLNDSQPGKGSVVVLVLPPHWAEDKGNEQKQLDKYKEKMESDGAKVMTVQADKSIWGYYKEHGPSDNPAILKEFSDKPFRDNSQIPLYGKDGEKGQAFRHKDIMAKVVEAAGNKGKITVFEDMDPYLAKAAQKAGIPKESIVGQSNHLTLLHAHNAGYFGNRSDAYLVKVNGNGYLGKAATIQLDRNINTTGNLGKSLKGFNLVTNGEGFWFPNNASKIRPEDKALAVRKRMLKLMLAKGNMYDLNGNAEVTRAGCVMAPRGATAQSIDRGVYIYLNKYANPLAQHIREKLNSDDGSELTKAYKKAAFLFCGTEAFQEDAKVNAMHVGQMANFDGISSAGFGTTSEMHYLLMNNAHQGRLIMMPIEHQHEQGANADYLLPQALEDRADRVDTARNIEELTKALDELILNKATTDDSLGESTMAPLFAAADEDRDMEAGRTRGTAKAVNLINGGDMSAPDKALLEDNSIRAQDSDRKALRRLNKVMIPALTALSNNHDVVMLKMKFDSSPKALSLKDLIQIMKSPAEAAGLMEADFGGPLAQEKLMEFAEALEELANVPDEQRKDAVAQYLGEDYANDKFILGY